MSSLNCRIFAQAFSDDGVTPHEFAGRNVDGDLVELHSEFAHGGQIPANTIDHPRAKFDDKTGFFGHWDEFPRGNRCSVLKIPTCQCFDTENFSGQGTDLWLISGVQAAV